MCWLCGVSGVCVLICCREREGSEEGRESQEERPCTRTHTYTHTHTHVL